jgi:hypothetical protein
MPSPLGLRIGPDCAKGNLPNGIAARTLANVTNFAITSSGTMLLNGIESTSAQPAYFHVRNQKQHKASPARFISRRNATWRVRLLLMNGLQFGLVVSRPFGRLRAGSRASKKAQERGTEHFLALMACGSLQM